MLLINSSADNIPYLLTGIYPISASCLSEFEREFQTIINPDRELYPKY